jgi:hypothetical protein
MTRSALPCRFRSATAMLLVLCSLEGASAQDYSPATLNLYGSAGLIDMPSGDTMKDGLFSFTYGAFGPISHTTLTFQITPRLSGSFRYSGVKDWNSVVPDKFTTYYDRSFDLRYRLTDEARYMPAITVGLQDFVGTGLYGAEYIVATKHLNPDLTVTAGLGWGRLGSYGSIGSTGTRPDVNAGLGGRANYDQWFRGPAAPFAGIEWHVNDKLGFKVEYSSDNYDVEADERETFDRNSPFNFGLEYQLSKSIRLGAYSLYGSQVGFTFQFNMNPKERTPPGIGGPAPLPVMVRPPRSSQPEAWSTSWASTPGIEVTLRDALGKALKIEGLRLDAFSLGPDRVLVRVQNLRYDAVAQAVGRTARLLSALMPASVETFDIVLVVDGMPASKVTLRRSDLEKLEFAPNGDAALLARAQIGEAGVLPDGALLRGPEVSRFTWAIEPFARTSLFDPDQPLAIDLRLRALASYELAEGLFITGAVTKKLAGNLDSLDRPSNSVLPHVRTDAYLYNRYGDPELENLNLAWYTHLSEDLYGRVTVGYLERMFGGISTELLWAPVDSQLALGAELNYTQQRAFETDFSFQDYRVATGYLSAYYDFNNGFLGQLDVGRYLAGDTGATLTLERYFANGWSIGAFATVTDVSAEDFGEGSFDKGILIRIPFNWLLNAPSRDVFYTVLRPVTRDGGARLNVNGRLYQTVRDYHKLGVESQWSRVWR